jgi:Asp/Glu/hydantoin racemase
MSSETATETAPVPTVAAIYTGRSLAQTVRAVGPEILGEVNLTSLIDDGLIYDIIRDGGITPAIRRRLIRSYENAQDAGAAVILNTCSSVGDIVDLGREVVDVPIVRIDEPMAETAVNGFERIGVIATLSTTLEPTVRLIEAKAKAAGKDVHLVAAVAEGAHSALASGDPAKHDRLLEETVTRLGDSVDVIVLAQASMARMEERLTEVVSVPVLTSLRSGLRAVRDVLDSQRGSQG